jgi:GDPmannose 4,6-dehydratase
LGNISITRDWGWAPEYVEAMWLMLQQEQADDYVIATGETNTLQDFVAEAFNAVGLDWKEHVISDTSLLRPSEIMVSCGDAARAAEILGWKARFRMRDVVRMMVADVRNGRGASLA